MPIVVLRETVLFPGATQQLDIVRSRSVLAVRHAIETGQNVIIVMQRDSSVDEPELSGLYNIGVIASVRQVLKHPASEMMRIRVECLCRASIETAVESDGILTGFAVERLDTPIDGAAAQRAAVRSLKEAVKQYIHLSNQKFPRNFLDTLSIVKNAGELADFVAQGLPLSGDKKQALLEQSNHQARCEMLIAMLYGELDIMQLQHDIEEKVQKNIEQNQKEYYLREQIKVISEQLGDSDSPLQEADEFRELISKADLPEDIAQRLMKECAKFAKLPQGSHEAAVERNYIEACLALPWNKKSKERADVEYAQKKLDRDHYGMEKVKERILEFVAVRALAPDIKGQIICLVGPPGVGKTSIARSVAQALGRKYCRVSLGGVHDEADIRGHRRTYIGSMPGRIANALKLAGTSNPLILLDEIDKLASDFRGDPTSALLEVLDPEQNCTFHDHYIDMPIDLSDVMFITTANDFSRIPSPLTDRMEVITLPSYTLEEKISIAKLHLLKKQLKRHGLNGQTLRITDKGMKALIEGYTREAGVRSLERELASICRKVAKRIASGEAERLTVTDKTLEGLIGPAKFKPELPNKCTEPGIANGLAWTSVGGTMLEIEVAILDGTGKIELTGSLGDVMCESARTAISYIRSRAGELGINPSFYKDKDIHIHVPEGATPKDGPSAGITMATAIISALTNIPVRGDVAMTGEITLRGRVLPIGGLREKSMAAMAAGMTTVIMPEGNLSDVSQLSETVRGALRFIPAKKLDDVLGAALTEMPASSAPQTVIPVVKETPTMPFVHQIGGNHEAGESRI